jgi:hypothetical protein
MEEVDEDGLLWLPDALEIEWDDWLDISKLF